MRFFLPDLQNSVVDGKSWTNRPDLLPSGQFFLFRLNDLDTAFHKFATYQNALLRIWDGYFTAISLA